MADDYYAPIHCFLSFTGAELPATDQWQREAELHGVDWREALHVDRVRHPAGVRVPQHDRSPQGPGE